MTNAKILIIFQLYNVLSQIWKKKKKSHLKACNSTLRSLMDWIIDSTIWRGCSVGDNLIWINLFSTKFEPGRGREPKVLIPWKNYIYHLKVQTCIEVWTWLIYINFASTPILVSWILYFIIFWEDIHQVDSCNYNYNCKNITDRKSKLLPLKYNIQYQH